MRQNVVVVMLLLMPALAGCFGGDEPPKPIDGGADSVPAPFSSTNVYPGTYRTDLHRPAEKGPYAALPAERTQVVSDLDGVDLMVHITRPDVPAGHKVGTILIATPYFAPDSQTPEALVERFVEHGFAVAHHAVRGSGDSGGCSDVFGPKEQADVDQVITWIAEQEWSNGNVGMYGGSYEGGTQWIAAATGNPHLKTIVPSLSMPSVYHLMIHNGTQQGFAVGGQLSLFMWLSYGALAYNPANGRAAQNTVESIPCQSGTEAAATGTLGTLMPDADPLDYYLQRDWRDEVLEHYEGTVFVQHGLRDLTSEPHAVYPFTNELQEQGVIVKQLIGPWGHEIPWRADWSDIMIHWYDRWLNENTSADIGPPVHVMDSLGDWRQDSTWPPTDAHLERLNMSAEGRLTWEAVKDAGAATTTAMVPVPDPDCILNCLNGMWRAYDRPLAEVCAECPRFTTDPLDAELRFAGAPLLRVAGTPSGPGGLLTAVLFAHAPDGTSHRVGHGATDLRFADGSEEASTVTPGAEIDIAVQLEPLDVVVPRGWRLELWLHQGGYGMRAPVSPAYPLELDLGPDKSHLSLPVIDPPRNAFFDAPPRVGSNTPPR